MSLGSYAPSRISSFVTGKGGILNNEIGQIRMSVINFATSQIQSVVVTETLKQTILQGVMAALALPAAILQLGYLYLF